MRDRKIIYFTLFDWWLFIFLMLLFFVGCKPVEKNEALENQSSTDVKKFTYLYSEALKYKMLGDNDKAKSLFYQCLDLDRNSTASAYQLSVLLSDEKNFEDACHYADFCLKLKPANEWFLVHRANLAYKMSDSITYQNIYSKLVTLFPDNMAYTYEMAQIHFKNSRFDQALHLLSGLEELIGVDENISFLRNHLYFSQKRYDAIQAELLKLKVFYPDSIKYMDMLADFYLNTNQADRAFMLYRAILDKDSANIVAKYGISTVMAKARKYDSGFDYLIDVLKDVEIDATKKESLVSLYLEAPKGLLSNEKINRIYQHVIYGSSPNVELLNSYLAFLFDLKKLTEAEKVAKHSITKVPNNFWAWDYLFKILVSQSRNDELSQFANKALEYFPNHAQIYFYSGYSLFVLRKWTESIRYLESGLNYIVDNKNLELQFLLYLAEANHQIGKHKKSDEYFNLYLKSDSSNAFLMNNYAFYLTSRNVETSKAERLAIKSIEIEPFNSTFLDTYSWILYNKKDYKQALNYIERAYRYGGNKNAVIVEHYGDILIQLGRKDEAVEKWKESLQLNKGNQTVIQKINSVKPD
jgi:predicted Zn-dependent protease